MLSQIKSLFTIATKPSRKIIGLMSGTSLDGLDIVLCQCSQSAESLTYNVEAFKTIPYDREFRDLILRVYSKKIGDIQELTILHSHIADVHANYVLDALMDWNHRPTDIDVIASHGQTIYHAPRSLHCRSDMPNSTLQIADADRIAVKTGIITLSDFRQKDIAYGGEGAPLAKYGDFLMYRNKDAHRVLINMGGIANFTYLPQSGELKDVICTDTGPANGLMNEYMRYLDPTKSLDKDGKFAAKGKIDKNLLQDLLSHPFIGFPIPKSTGPEAFNLEWVMKLESFSSLSHFDVFATLNYFSAYTIAEAIRSLVVPIDEILLSGGGIHNNTLMANLKLLLKEYRIDILPNADAKEALFFALFANEMLCGSNNRINFGKISLP